MGGYFILICIPFIFIIAIFAWHAYTVHCEDQNARDIHRMIKNGEFPTNSYSQRTNSSASDQGSLSSVPSLTQTKQNTWKCICGQENSVGLSYCTYCRRFRYSATKKCPHCGAINDNSSNYCRSCHESMTLSVDETNKKEAQQNKKMAEETTLNKDNTSSAFSQNKQIELIKHLAELHQSGILTDDEFNAKKAELLSKL